MREFSLRKIFIIVLCSIAVMLFAYPLTVLEIYSLDRNDVVFRKEVYPDYVFATLIRHSVHLSPVYEYYLVSLSGEIVLIGTKIQDLGWGVPSTFEEDLIFKDSFMVISGLHKHMNFIPFRLSKVANPRLILWDGTILYPLRKLENWDRLDIYVKEYPCFILLFKGEKNELI
ncbi:MAG: DUF1850 domain-containing protein [Synergistetes bacterium]|nr:DUF1850 domain-containing protein [Synergistota bacterium]